RSPAGESFTPYATVPSVGTADAGIPAASHALRSITRGLEPPVNQIPNRSTANSSGEYDSNSPCTTSWLIRVSHAGLALRRVSSNAGSSSSDADHSNQAVETDLPEIAAVRTLSNVSP